MKLSELNKTTTTIKTFDWNAFANREIVVYCATEEEAESFIKEAVIKEFHWDPFTDPTETFWNNRISRVDGEIIKGIYYFGNDQGRLTYGTLTPEETSVNWSDYQ